MEEETKDVKEVKRYKLELTTEQVDVIFRGLLEMPAKYALLVIREIETQLRGQEDASVQQDIEK